MTSHLLLKVQALNVLLTTAHCLLVESSQFLRYSGHCLHPWESLNPESKRPLLLSVAMCSSRNNCDAVQCDSTLSQCEHVISSNGTNTCYDDPYGNSSILYLNSKTVSFSDELFIALPAKGQMWSLDNLDRDPILFPPWPSKGNHLAMEYNGNLLTCATLSKECFIWTFGSDQWNSFPSFGTGHESGAFLLLQGKPIAIGGVMRGEDQVLQRHNIVEIFNGTGWSEGPNLPTVFRSFLPFTINDSAIGILALNITTVELLIIDALTMNWRMLSHSKPLTDGLISCVVLPSIAPNGLCCFSLRGIASTTIFDLNLSGQEGVVGNETVPTRPSESSGNLYLREDNTLYYYVARVTRQAPLKIYTMDLNKQPLDWKKIVEHERPDDWSKTITSFFHVNSFVYNHTP